MIYNQSKVNYKEALMSSKVCSIVSMYTKGVRELLVRAEVAV